MFRELSPEEELEFRQWARDNHKPNEPINPLWHPIIRQECSRIDDECNLALNRPIMLARRGTNQH
jgi:hypothetical protein